MKILVFGAGVIGSVYGGRLLACGHEVTFLARGERAAQLRAQGVVLEDPRRGRTLRLAAPVVEGLGPEDAYDVVLVAMQSTQVDAVLPALAANRASHTVAFMVNTARGHDRWTAAVGATRFVAVFPGAGGLREGASVKYHVVPGLLQPTTLGGTAAEERIAGLARALRRAGFPVARCRDMDAWQKSHVAWISPLAQALYAAGGLASALARDRALLLRTVDAIGESFSSLRALGVPVLPWRLSTFEWLPRPVLAYGLAQFLRSPMARVAVEAHANLARSEMTALAAELAQLVDRAGLPCPALRSLFEWPTRRVA